MRELTLWTVNEGKRYATYAKTLFEDLQSKRTGTSILIGSVISAGFALLPISSSLSEELAEGSLQVTAHVIAVCSVVSEGLHFGAYNADDDTDGSAVLTVTCSTPTDGEVSLGLGTNHEDEQRQMASGSFRLAYGLFQDPDRNIPFAGAPITGTPGGAGVTVYGRIPAEQTAAPVGDYTDTVLITFAY